MNTLTINYNSTGGYGRVSLGLGNTKRVHSLVARAFLGARPIGLQVNHKDSDKRNNRADNLEYISGSDNCKQTFLHRIRDMKGENHNRAKLSNEDVRTIRDMVRNGYSNKSIAELYDVDPSLISHIKRGKKWN